MSQAMLSEVTGINRSMIGRIENEEYLPRLDQLEVLLAQHNHVTAVDVLPENKEKS